jgi:murein DD-endopeptidase MepM/ murein hydrolase activator NlpD
MRRPLPRASAAILAAALALLLRAESPAPSASPPPSGAVPSTPPPASPATAPSSAAAAPLLEIQPDLKQGQILVLRLRSPGVLSDMSAAIARTDAQGKERVLSRATGAPRRMLSGENAMLAFLAIPLSAAAGEYILSVSVKKDAWEFKAQAAVTVKKRESPSMDIKLTPELTGIRASPDPRKDAEAQELTELLYFSDPSADYAYQPFLRPLQEKAVTSTFGDARRYLYAGGGSSTSVHYGLDLYQDEGAIVHASGRGRVVLAKARIVTGNSVVIEHAPGLYSLYFHLSRIDVAVGALVEPGAAIGAVGSTGLATGPHLHWELRLGAEPMDPECLVGNYLLSGLAPP